MRFKALAFRFRAWIDVALYLIGFLTPWDRFLYGGRESALWLAASALLARTGWMDLSLATKTVTFVALCCCLVGAALRVWATAWLGPSVRRDSAIESGELAPAGPYRRTRNPLYAGTLVFSLGASILMPPSGALFFLLAMALFHWLLISAEKDFPQSRYAAPHWLQALAAEIYPIGYTLSFAVLAWRYNTGILIQALLVCFGLSLVIRAAWALPVSS